MVFWGDNEALTARKYADCTKDRDTLIEQSVILIITVTEALLL